MLKLRHEADDRPDHFQVYTGQVRIGTIYKISGNPGVRSPSAPGNHLPEKKSRSGRSFAGRGVTLNSIWPTEPRFFDTFYVQCPPFRSTMSR